MPDEWSEIGRGRLKQLILNDNKFTGVVPGQYRSMNKLNAIEVQNNDFSELEKSLCDYSVFFAGEVIALKADCEICSCDIFCDDC